MNTLLRLAIGTSLLGILSAGALCFAQEGPTRSTLPTPRQTESLEEYKPHVGFRAGMVDPNDDHENALQYGIEYGFQPYIPFGLGVELTRFQSKAADTPDLDRVSLLARATYNFGGTIPIVKNSYLGAALGPVNDNVDGVNYIRLGTDLTLGFDIPVTGSETAQNTWTVGVLGNYLWVTDTDADLWALNGVVKYWF